MKKPRTAVAGLSIAVLLLAAIISPGHAAAAKVPNSESASGPPQAPEAVLLDILQSELHRAMGSLGNTTAGDTAPQPKPYFLSYAVSDSDSIAIAAQFGALTGIRESRRRSADVQVRLGSPAEDNTHGDHRNSAITSIPLPLGNDPDAIARSLWYATNRGYGKALDAFLKVKTDQQVRAKEEDASADFSAEKPATAVLPPSPALTVDRAAPGRVRHAGTLRPVPTVLPDVFFNNVTLEASTETDSFVSSEGARVATPTHVARLVIVARARAADGMDLFRAETFEADDSAHLPEQKTLTEKTLAMAKDLEALREAPITEPYEGPAILSGRASAVFFHEVLGHRARRPAPARRRGGPDLHQAARQTDPSRLPQRLRRPPPSPSSTVHRANTHGSAATTATTTKASPPAASTSSKTAYSIPS